MASIRKKKNSRYWWACVSLPNGKRRQFSTKLEDEAAALELAIRTENGLKRQRDTNHLIESLTRLAEEFTGEASTKPADWFARWVDRRSSEVSPRTAQSYRKVITDLSEQLTKRSIVSFASITPAALIEIRDEFASQHSASTANHRMKIIRSALADAVREKIIQENPAQHIRNLKKSQTSTRRAFTQLELQALLEAADAEWRAAILMAVCYGPRRSDLCGLRWSNIDQAAGVIQFRTSKTGKPILLPIIDPVENALESLPCADHPGAHVFPSLGSMTGGAISNSFRSVMVKAGLAKKRTWRTGQTPTGQRKPSELSFHSLRYTANSFLKAAGIPDAIVMAIVGHETKAMSDHYTGFDAATLKSAMDRADFSALSS